VRRSEFETCAEILELCTKPIRTTKLLHLSGTAPKRFYQIIERLQRMELLKVTLLPTSLGGQQRGLLSRAPNYRPRKMWLITSQGLQAVDLWRQLRGLLGYQKTSTY
jgi:hypothetical protein